MILQSLLLLNSRGLLGAVIILESIAHLSFFTCPERRCLIIGTLIHIQERCKPIRGCIVHMVHWLGTKLFLS
ncbi:unnamed protein product [Moneuplotes crassus]|uniref:Uncharacterized protein n=1 Tax=Euplotes crassus TaxID=5936 RepID=A0AAD1UD09_EUPCR|nr:unnamed protein product [Moneuplotes crassus]